MPLAETGLGCSSPLVGHHTCWLGPGAPKGWRGAAVPQAQPAPSTEPCCRGTAWPCYRRAHRAPVQMAAGPPSLSAAWAGAGLGLLLTFAFPGTTALSHGPARAGLSPQRHLKLSQPAGTLLLHRLPLFPSLLGPGFICGDVFLWPYVQLASTFSTRHASQHPSTFAPLAK